VYWDPPFFSFFFFRMFEFVFGSRKNRGRASSLSSRRPNRRRYRPAFCCPAAVSVQRSSRCARAPRCALT
jgi:hypothetical protein